MRNSLRIGRLFGIPVTLHVTFLLFVVLLGMVYLFQGGLVAAVRGVLFILALFLSVTIHEFGHSLVARRFGVKVTEITLLPIGGVSKMARLPEQPRQELLISIAGPLTSLGLAVLFGAASLLLYGPAATFRASVTGGRFVADLARVNVLLALFNLLPGFPMDGGRIFRSILARTMSFARATAVAATVGRVFAVGLGILGLFSSIWLVFIAIFIYFGAGQESRDVQFRAALHDIPVRRVMATEFKEVSPDDAIGKAVEYAYHGFQEDFPVTREGAVVGMLLKNDILTALHEHGPELAVSEVMRPGPMLVEPRQTLEQVYGAIQACKCSSLPVVENGRIVGVVTLEALGRFFAFSTAERT
jgi:Zn-dependent protease